MSNKKTTPVFISEAIAVHGSVYDYSLTEYVNAHTKVKIKCKHGIFEILPYAHIHQKQGCYKCGIEKRKHPLQKTNEQFINQAKDKWGNKYNYSITEYKNKQTKIKYICEKHGIQHQLPTQHLKHGCQFCNGRGISKHSLTSLINIANVIHENKYSYAKTVFVRMSDKIIITCPIHGDFEQRAGNHIHLKNGCPSCGAIIKISQPQKEIYEYIKENYNGTILQNDRKILEDKEIDIYLPELNLGFEYHGIYWHLETVRGRKYHYNKCNAALGKNINLVQIYSTEWEDKKDIIKSKVINLLGKSNKIYARKTKIVELKRYETEEFLTINHIQGPDNAKIKYGLEYNGNIVACMTFDGSRFNRSYKYEMIRFCTKNFTSVVGGASKLLNHFRTKYKGSIITYADRRYSQGKLYKAIGFKFDGVSRPSFSYFNIRNNTMHSRLSFQKKNLISMPFYDKNLKEWEIMQLNGYDRIWDAGQMRFVLDYPTAQEG